MEARILSLDEANRMLPLLSRIVRDIMENWNLIVSKRAELETIERGQGQTDSAALEQVKQELNSLIDRINSYIREVEELGCYVEEFRRGIVNMPTLYHGRKVFFCWKAGEEKVSYWHELDETFHDRMKIEDPNEFLCENPLLSGPHGSGPTP